MDAVSLSVIALVLTISTIVSALMVWRGIVSIEGYKLVQRTPTSICVDVDEGLVEVKGTMEPIGGSHLTSPLADIPCVQYESTIEERVGSGKHAHWRTVFEKREGHGFLVRDPSGLTKVLTLGADLRMETAMSETTSSLGGMSEDARIALGRFGLPKKGTFGLFYRIYRLREKVLRLNKQVYVLGDASEMRMERELEDDPKVNPYTISKKDVLIVSTEDETTVASNLLMKGIVLIGGAIFIETVVVGLVLSYVMSS